MQLGNVAGITGAAEQGMQRRRTASARARIEDDRDAGERHQRQRKTGFQGPAVEKPAEQPTQTPAQIGMN